MAYRIFENNSNNDNSGTDNSSDTLNHNNAISFEQGAQRADLPASSFVKDANLSRDGVDLVLETDNGTVVVEGYFAAAPAPNLVAPDGATLTPDLVNSFLSSGSEFANAGSGINDASPIGAVQEVSGEVTVTRVNGTTETVGIGTPIFQGDVIETDESGAVNIMFVDETSFAVSEDARLAIDEYVFDASTQSGTSNFSVLKGVFVFTSGLIGRDDPDDVMIDTPSGSIGIRGTIIAGDVNTGEITVIEGAIVLTDFAGNSITLSNQFETARFNTSSKAIEHIGDLSANDVSAKFMSVSTVAADLFSSIQDAANDAAEAPTSNDVTEAEGNSEEASAEDSNAAAPEEAPQDTTDIQANETVEGEAEVPVEAESETVETDEASEGEVETPIEAESDIAEEVITSNDIIDTETNASNANENINNNVAPQNTEPLANIGANAPANDAPPAPTNDAPPPPPFSIDVTTLAVQENIAGATVATVEGNFTNFTRVSILGISQNYYEAINTGPNSVLIKLKPGVSYDAENPYPLVISAQNEDGSVSLDSDIPPNIIGVDEAITLTGEMPDNFFSASDGSNFSYDLSQEFDDPEGNITGYTLLDGLGNPITLDSSFNSNIESSSFNPNTGLLGIRFFSEEDGSDGTEILNAITVQATTDSGQIETATINFSLYDDTGAGATISGNNAVYTGTDATVTVIGGSNASIFTDGDDTDNALNILGGKGAFIKAGAGDDVFTVSGNRYELFGDEGNDTFSLINTNGQAFGGDGDDTFVIGENSLAENTTINGGAGNDILQFDAAGSIDLNNTTLNNIEVLSADNGLSNVINLDQQSVIDMTDGENQLIINMGTADSVEFESGQVFENLGTQDIGNETYDVFNDGTITLLIDIDGTHNLNVV